MKRQHSEPTVSRHVKLYESDWDFLLARAGGAGGLGPGELVRKIVHQKVKWLRQGEIDKLDEKDPSETAEPTAATAEKISSIMAGENLEEEF